MRYWLMKSEPGSYSLFDLEKDARTLWNGVRNYQARNFMRDDMAVGDLVLFHHSNAEPPGVAGIARVSREAVPETGPWVQPELAFVERFPSLLSLSDLKADPKLEGMLLLKRGTRLSVQPVDKAHFLRIQERGRKAARA